MSAVEWLLAVVSVGLLVMIWQLLSVGGRLAQVVETLMSIDSEVFHLAQEYNPQYGQYDNCGRRALVRHVLPKNRESAVDLRETFYRQACWWMSDSVDMGDESRPTKTDRASAMCSQRRSVRDGPDAIT